MRLQQVRGAARPSTVLGLLQRGRGAGWVQVARGAAESDVLLEAIRTDMRWAAPVESREDYFATLALHVKLPAAAVAEAAGHSDDEDYAREILAAMAKRGSADAEAELAKLPPDDDGVFDPWVPPEQPPADAPIDVVMSSARPPYPTAILERLRLTQIDREVANIRQAALDPSDTQQWRLALRVLRDRRDPVLVPQLEHWLTSDNPTLRIGARWYAEALPAAAALPLARAWLAFDDDRGRMSKRVMRFHAEPADVPVIRAALEVEANYYAAGDLVAALARHPVQGPYPELERVYVTAAYSHTRGEAAAAMAASDPGFGSRYAIECLWDCEPDARIAGIRHTPLTGAWRRRIQELAEDKHEEPSVRDAARERLALTPGEDVTP